MALVFRLLATKLHVPGSLGYVPGRGWRNGGMRDWSRGLVLVCALAGYGKTVLLADRDQRGQWR